jgi:ABC-2 type transport system ATP-binding protein
MEIVCVDQVTKIRGRSFTLGPLSLSLRAGEILGIMGPNGAGKTTLLRLIWGFSRPDTGSLRVFGVTPHLAHLEVRLRAGYLSESPRFYGWMQARRFLRFIGSFYDGWEEQRALELVHLFRIDPEKRVDQLSKGSRVKLGLVCALAHRPKLLIMDEPTSGLDPVIRVDILRFLKQLAQEEHVAMLMSSLILNEGRCVEYAPTAVLLRQYSMPRLETIFLHAIGKSPQNSNRDKSEGLGGT